MFFVVYVSVYLSHASSNGSFPDVFLHVFLCGAAVMSLLKHVSGIVRFVPVVPCVSDVFFICPGILSAFSNTCILSQVLLLIWYIAVSVQD